MLHITLQIFSISKKSHNLQCDSKNKSNKKVKTVKIIIDFLAQFAPEVIGYTPDIFKVEINRP